MSSAVISICMKKLEEILRRERLGENPEFRALFGEYQECKRLRDQARETHRAVKRNYRKAKDDDKLDKDALFELRHQARREKYMARYHREGYRLVRNRLRAWIDQFLAHVIELQEPTGSSDAKGRSKKQGTEKDDARHKKTAAPRAKHRIVHAPPVEPAADAVGPVAKGTEDDGVEKKAAPVRRIRKAKIAEETPVVAAAPRPRGRKRVAPEKEPTETAIPAAPQGRGRKRTPKIA